MKRILTARHLGFALILCALLCAPLAQAGIMTYSGQDDGALTTGPFPNSSAAEALFLAAAVGLSPVGLITFEDQLTGYNASFTAAPGVTVDLTGPNYGDGYSGISATTVGNLYGFNITAGGAKWLGFPTGTATFSFANPTDYFGFWLTGVQTVFTSTLTVSFNDGSSEVLNAPINVNGGAAYFGFTDASKSISSITITNLSDDAWGIDNVSYDSTSAVPEPSTMILLGGGLLALLAARRRKA